MGASVGDRSLALGASNSTWAEASSTKFVVLLSLATDMKCLFFFPSSLRVPFLDLPWCKILASQFVQVWSFPIHISRLLPHTLSGSCNKRQHLWFLEEQALYGYIAIHLKPTILYYTLYWQIAWQLIGIWRRNWCSHYACRVNSSGSGLFESPAGSLMNVQYKPTHVGSNHQRLSWL